VYLLPLFVVAGCPGGRVPSHDLLGPGHCRWWFEKCCFLCCDLQVTFIDVFDERIIGWWKGAEFNRWCSTLACFRTPRLDPAFGHGCAWLCYLAICRTYELSGLSLHWFHISLHITNFREGECSLLGNYDNSCRAYAMQWCYSICSGAPMNCQKIICYVAVCCCNGTDIDTCSLAPSLVMSRSLEQSSYLYT